MGGEKKQKRKQDKTTTSEPKVPKLLTKLANSSSIFTPRSKPGRQETMADSQEELAQEINDLAVQAQQYAERRLEEVKGLEPELEEVLELFTKMQELVSVQSKLVNKLEENIGISRANVKIATNTFSNKG